MSKRIWKVKKTMWRAWRDTVNWYSLKLVGLHKSLNGRMKTHSSDHVYENNAASSTGWGISVCLKLWKRVHMQVRIHSSQSRTKKPPIAVPWCLTERGLLFVPCLNTCTCTQTHSHTKKATISRQNYKLQNASWPLHLWFYNLPTNAERQKCIYFNLSLINVWRKTSIHKTGVIHLNGRSVQLITGWDLLPPK